MPYLSETNFFIKSIHFLKFFLVIKKIYLLLFSTQIHYMPSILKNLRIDACICLASKKHYRWIFTVFQIHELLKPDHIYGVSNTRTIIYPTSY